jgi:aminoglycoside phosphotransferase (APT) family kinase protein
VAVPRIQSGEHASLPRESWEGTRQRGATWTPDELFTAGGHVSAVIDWGGLAISDPACDLTVAFTLMSARSRAAFRDTLEMDDATWTRGRGWALATGLNAYTSYAAVNCRVAAQTTRQITEALLG